MGGWVAGALEEGELGDLRGTNLQVWYWVPLLRHAARSTCPAPSLRPAHRARLLTADRRRVRHLWQHGRGAGAARGGRRHRGAPLRFAASRALPARAGRLGALCWLLAQHAGCLHCRPAALVSPPCSCRLPTYALCLLPAYRLTHPRTLPPNPAAIPGLMPEEMVAPVADSVGIRLLQRMGWRQGKGIGARGVGWGCGCRCQQPGSGGACAPAAPGQGCWWVKGGVGWRGWSHSSSPARSRLANTLPRCPRLHAPGVGGEAGAADGAEGEGEEGGGGGGGGGARRRRRWGQHAAVGAQNTALHLLAPKTDVHGLGYDPFKVRLAEEEHMLLWNMLVQLAGRAPARRWPLLAALNSLCGGM